MQSTLKDIVSHTHDLGVIELVRITGDAEKTAIYGLAKDRSVVIEGQFINAVPEFAGTFGMPNLNKLKVILDLSEYKENAKLSITNNPSGEPSGIHFENSTKDFKNDYRFMSSAIVNEKLKSVKFRGVNWNIEFSPSVAAIQRLKMQASANAEEETFQAKTENGELKFYFGDHSTHAGNFVFESNPGGELKKSWAWPVKTVISILDLVGDKTFKISDDGAAQITVDSGVGIYNYILPSQQR